jgi:hypothetical protein
MQPAHLTDWPLERRAVAAQLARCADTLQPDWISQPTLHRIAVAQHNWIATNPTTTSSHGRWVRTTNGRVWYLARLEPDLGPDLTLRASLLAEQARYCPPSVLWRLEQLADARAHVTALDHQRAQVLAQLTP